MGHMSGGSSQPMADFQSHILLRAFQSSSMTNEQLVLLLELMLQEGLCLRAAYRNDLLTAIKKREATEEEKTIMTEV